MKSKSTLTKIFLKSKHEKQLQKLAGIIGFKPLVLFGSKIGALILIFLLSASIIQAQITSTATGGTWATGSTWVGGVAPTAGQAVVIATTGANAVSIGTTVTQTGSGSVTVNSGARLNITTTGVDATFGALTINTGGIVTIYRDFTVLGTTNIAGTINFGSTSGTNRTMTFTGDVTLSSGAVWNETATGAVADFSFGGNFTNNAATFTAQNDAAAVHTFTTASKSLSGTTVTSIPYVTISGTRTNNGTLSVSAVLAGSSTLTNGATGILNIGGTSPITTLTATAVGNIVNYSGSAQTCKVTTYDDLTLSGSGAKTFATTPTVNGILSLEGTASAVVTTGVITYGTNATLQYNKPAAYTATAEEWITPFAATGGVIIANTGAITMDAAKVFDVSVPLTINSGATLVTNNLQLTLGGNFVNGGTLTAGSSPVIIANTMTTQSIAGFTTTGLVSMTKTAGTATLLGNVNGAGITLNGTGGTLNLGTALTHTFTGDLTLTAGTLNGGSSTLRLGGGFSGTGVTFTAATGTVEWYANGPQTIPGGGYYNLIFSGVGTKTVPASTTIAANLTINGSAAMAFSGTSNTANALFFGASQQVAGTWGFTGSGATNINTTFFSGTAGYVTVATGSCTPPATGLTVGGAGSVCSGSGTNITVALSESGVNYQLRNGVTAIGAPVAGTTGTISLPTGNLTSVTTFNVLATNISTSCAAQLTGTATVTVNALPNIALTVGGAGAVCSGSGTNITVALSESGVNYQLRNGVTTIGTPVAGTGGTINLPTGNLTSAATFNVLATNASTSCAAQLTGTAAVTVNAPPDITLTVGGSGSVCSGSGTNITVGLSETGVNYQLRNILTLVGTPVTGTGGTINLPTGNLTSATTFNVLATNTTSSCSAQLTGTAAVTINALPNIALTVGGAGAVCTGTGTNVTVALSEIGVNYQLRNGVTTVGSPVAGTGGTIGLPTGNLTTGTTFNVLATNTTSSCFAQLTGTAAITVSAPPNTSLVVGGAGAVCSGSGTNITVALSESGVNYQLRNGVTPVGAAVAGTGGTINLPTGNLASAVTFNVLATNATAGNCSVQLTTTATVTVNSLPSVAAIAGGAAAVCVNSVTPAFTNATGGGIWSIVPVSGGSASITSGGVVTGLGAGTVAVTYTVTSGCANSATQLLTVNASTTVAPITGTATISIGSSTILASATPGGIWTSGTPTNAIVNSSTGEVTGIALGTSLITYTVSNGSGCAGTATMLVTVSTVSGIEDLQDSNGMMLRNHPNPFTGNTTLTYTLPSDGRVTLSIRTMAGQVVKTILSEMETEGDYIINVEVGDLPSGVYLGTLSLKKNGKEILKTIRMVKGK